VLYVAVMDEEMILISKWRRCKTGKSKSRGRRKILVSRDQFSVMKSQSVVRLQLHRKDCQGLNKERITMILNKKSEVKIYMISSVKNSLFGRFMCRLCWKIGILRYSLLVNTLKLISDIVACNDVIPVETKLQEE